MQSQPHPQRPPARGAGAWITFQPATPLLLHQEGQAQPRRKGSAWGPTAQPRGWGKHPGYGVQRAVTLGGPRPATAPYVDVGHSTAVGWLGNVSAPAMSPGPGVAQIYGGSLVGASCALYHVSTALVTHSWVAIKPVPRHCHRCPGAESALESCPHLLHPRLQGTAPGDLLLWLTGEPTDNGACL